MEDIKILEEFIEYFEAEATSRKYRRNISITVGEDDIEAIENLIARNKELESALDNSVSKDEIKAKIEAIDEELEIMRVDNMYGRYKDYGGKMKFEEMFTYKYAKKDTYNELLNKGE